MPAGTGLHLQTTPLFDQAWLHRTTLRSTLCHTFDKNQVHGNFHDVLWSLVTSNVGHCDGFYVTPALTAGIGCGGLTGCMLV